MKNALNNQVGMLGDMFLWFVANLKQGVVYLVKQACGNDILASVYIHLYLKLRFQKFGNFRKKKICTLNRQMHRKQILLATSLDYVFTCSLII